MLDTMEGRVHRMNQKRHYKRKEIEGNIAELEHLIQEYNGDATNIELQRVCNEWLNIVFLKIRNQQYELAEAGFYGMFHKNNNAFLNTDSAILDFMFKVHKKEAQNGEESILRLLTSPEQMQHIYFELKFLVRRFEYDLPYELKEELFPFLQQYPISAYAICEMIEFYVSKKEKVLNDVAVFLFQKECYEYVLPLLSSAYETNPDDSETLYNMAYVLYAFQECETALQLIGRISNPSDRDRHLYHVITEGGDLPNLYSKASDEKRDLPRLDKPDKSETIAFILCVNEDRQFRECRYYIDHLLVPDGYSVEVIPIYQAKSITSGYQQGMQRTNAKYKVYMHQDVLCTNLYLLYDLISVFNQNPNIGMVGVAGCIKMPDTGVWWQAQEGRYYNLYQDKITLYEDNCRVSEEPYNCGEYQEVQALDGVFLATSKDVDWREDLFDGWHHYDVSQSMEFQRRGYKVVISKPHSLWILHNEKCSSILGKPYWQSAMCFLKEYMEDMLQ